METVETTIASLAKPDLSSFVLYRLEDGRFAFMCNDTFTIRCTNGNAKSLANELAKAYEEYLVEKMANDRMTRTEALKHMAEVFVAEGTSVYAVERPTDQVRTLMTEACMGLVGGMNGVVLYAFLKPGYGEKFLEGALKIEVPKE